VSARDYAAARLVAAVVDRDPAARPVAVIQIAVILREADRRREDPDGEPLVPVARSLRTWTFSSWEIDGSRAERSVMVARRGCRYGTPPGGIPTVGVEFQVGPGADHGEIVGLCWHGLRICASCVREAA